MPKRRSESRGRGGDCRTSLGDPVVHNSGYGLWLHAYRDARGRDDRCLEGLVPVGEHCSLESKHKELAEADNILKPC